MNAPWLLSRARIRAALNLLPFLVCVGCSQPFTPIDRSLAAEARLALFQERPPPSEEEENLVPGAGKEKPRKSVVVAELLAIFPGLFWHGLGHQYAGDDKTAKEIRNLGHWGYLLGAIGGGLVVGGYFLDRNSGSEWEPYAITLYVTGGITGGAGAGLFLAAWFYDMIDTPRAIRTGGQPPPSGPFTRDLHDINRDEK
jgi:hypothetical protein